MNQGLTLLPLGPGSTIAGSAEANAGVDPHYRTYSGDDPIGFVVSFNLARRHLDESQRAMAAAELANLHGAGRPETASDEAISTSRAAEMLNVGRSTVQRARKVREHGAPELIAAVEAGQIPVSVAADLAQDPPPDRSYIGRAPSPEANYRAAPRPIDGEALHVFDGSPEGDECRGVNSHTAFTQSRVIGAIPKSVSEQMTRAIVRPIAGFGGTTCFPGKTFKRSNRRPKPL